MIEKQARKTNRRSKTELNEFKKKDLLFIFKYPALKCRLDFEVFDENDRTRIQSELEIMTNEIVIDKSYVDYAGTKYEKTFMSEEGWDSLCQLVVETNFGKKASKREKNILDEAYRMMITCYAYQFFEDAGYEIADMQFEMPENAYFMVTVEEDTVREWERYPGKWQTWYLN